MRSGAENELFVLLINRFASRVPLESAHTACPMEMPAPHVRYRELVLALQSPCTAHLDRASHPNMPSSDYGNAVGGGLKLKGAKDAGVKKRKKSHKPKMETATKAVEKVEKPDDDDETALQRALAAEEQGSDGEVVKKKESEVKEYGKTEAQRRFEERRRKTVCHMPIY